MVKVSGQLKTLATSAVPRAIMGVVPLVSGPGSAPTLPTLTGATESRTGAPEPPDTRGLLQTFPMGARVPPLVTVGATLLGRP